MNITEAKNIGGRQALISVVAGLLIAQFIITLLLAPSEGFIKAFTWMSDVNYLYNILAGVLTMLLSGYLYGELAGREILIKRRDYTWVGFKYGMLTLWTGAFAGSLIGFLEEGFDKIGMQDDPFYDYLFKPLFWVTLFGVIPVLIVGFWFGRQIKKRGT